MIGPPGYVLGGVATSYYHNYNNLVALILFVLCFVSFFLFSPPKTPLVLYLGSL